MILRSRHVFFGVVRLLLVATGVFLIWYGLNQFSPWLAWAAVGGLLLMLGILG